MQVVFINNCQKVDQVVTINFFDYDAFKFKLNCVLNNKRVVAAFNI